MTKKDRNGIALKSTTIIAVVGMVTAAIAAHFNGIAEGKTYTDTKVHELRTEQMQEIKEVKGHMQQLSEDSAVMKSIMVKRYGYPEDHH